MTERFDVKIYKSDKKKHRFLASLTSDTTGDVKKVYFGATQRLSTYYDEVNEKKKEAYITRHGADKANQDWSASGIFTSGFWSRWFLWEYNKKDIEKIIRNIKKKSGGKIKSIKLMYSI